MHHDANAERNAHEDAHRDANAEPNKHRLLHAIRSRKLPDCWYGEFGSSLWNADALR